MKRTATWVKICGTTNLCDAQASVDAGANALGFVFAPSVRQIDTRAARDIIAALSGEVEAIGVFVNESPERMSEIADTVGLTGVQLHGDEQAAKLREFRRVLGQRKIIKSLPASALNHMDTVAEYLQQREFFDAVLLDSGSAQQRGGTGVAFDWEAAAASAAVIREHMPLIVAGGLGSDNVGRALDLFEPWGVDAVSGVESSPGMKDDNKLRAFMAAIRQHS